MIIGAHSIVYSKEPEADRAFLRDVLALTNVDVGEGWLIFGLPPAEVAVHPSDENDVHEFYFMVDDVDAFVLEMKEHRIRCTPVQDMGWGRLTELALPGGGKLGVYQPRHARPKTMDAANPKGARGTRKQKPAAKGGAKQVGRKASVSKVRRR